MTAATTTYPTLGHELAAKLHHPRRLSRRTRPRSKRSTTKRQPKRKTPRNLSPIEAAEAELRAAPGGSRALALIQAEEAARATAFFAGFNLKDAQRREAQIREQYSRATPLVDRGTTAADCLARHRDVERLAVKLRKAEGDTRDARAQLASAQMELEAAGAEFEQHLTTMAP